MYIVIYTNAQGKETRRSFTAWKDACAFSITLDRRIEKGTCIGYSITQR